MLRLTGMKIAAEALVVLAPFVFAPATAQSADYPNRTITFVVGFAPGGGIDTFARVIAHALTQQFGYQILIENRPGAASNIAAKAVAGAPPDGYTLLFTGNSYAINQTLYRNPGYATADLRPVAFAAIDSMALVVNGSHTAHSLPEFLAAAQGKPFSFGFGGSSARIASEYVLKVLAKADAIGVPFQSGAPALNALLGGHVDIIAAPIAEVVPQAQRGAVRALAVTGPQRAAAFPDVPTLSEVGLPGLAINGWIGLLAPADIPPDIGAKLNAAVNTVVAEPRVDDRLRALGYEPYRGRYDDAPAFLRKQIDAWGAMIRATGMTAD
jgi:tripartite-type tricarboxylate transporter receptor subunit TctC